MNVDSYLLILGCLFLSLVIAKILHRD